MSGLPGKRRSWRRYRRPIEKRYFRTTISGLVSLVRTPAIRSLRLLTAVIGPEPTSIQRLSASCTTLIALVESCRSASSA